ncbi:MAG: hypothetical protein QM796_18535 [Chthoniobacteraceae bacterium]
MTQGLGRGGTSDPSLLTMNDFDLSRFLVEPTATSNAPPKEPPVRRRVAGEFLRGPIPLSWLSIAARCPGKVLHVALAIWFEFGRRNQARFRLSNAILNRFGVSRKPSYHALLALEAAGLITVERTHGKNPFVTLHQADDFQKISTEQYKP